MWKQFGPVQRTWREADADEICLTGRSSLLVGVLVANAHEANGEDEFDEGDDFDDDEEEDEEDEDEADDFDDDFDDDFEDDFDDDFDAEDEEDEEEAGDDDDVEEMWPTSSWITIG